MPKRFESLPKRALKRSQWARQRSNISGGRNTAFFVYNDIMAVKNKQVKLNNYSVVDTNPSENSLDISEFEKDIINKYINKHLNDVLPGTGDDIELVKISSNFFYDSYGIVSNNKKFLLKISLDPDNEKLSTEKNSLECISDFISPQVISYDKDYMHGVEFLLTTWENGESFEIFGIDDFIYNLGTFCAVADGVHESKNEDAIDFKNNFLRNESVLSLFETIDDKELLIFEKLVDLNIQDVEKIFLKIKDDYLPQYTEDIPVLCHGNMKPSNILYLEGYIKLINFEFSFKCDLYYSLLKTVTDLYLYHNEKTVKEFLVKYHNASRILGDLNFNEFFKNYEKKKKINTILLFQDLLHKILFHFVAYGAYYNSEYLIKYMNTYLNLKPTIEEVFPEYINSFDKLFFTVMPTVKTYDMEQLKIIRNM
jgi:hypothetical protein